MNRARSGLLYLLIFFSAHSFASSSQRPIDHPDAIAYTLCIDGGGSKTSLQIVDPSGAQVAFQKNGILVNEVRSGSSNINAVGLQGLENLFRELFDGIVIDGSPIESIGNRCSVVGGFAGAAAAATVESITTLIRQWNFQSIEVTSDIGILSQFIQANGIALIAGTGSICFAKYGDATLRVGGLGRYLGDEGSGYFIGKSAIKASLEKGYGYGQDTVLVQELCNYFKLENISQIVRPYYAGTITPQDVAGVAPLVFQYEDSDPVAHNIVASAADDLAKMLQIAVRTLNMEPSPIYLVGGIFKNTHKDRFIQTMVDKAGLHGWDIRNISLEHPVVALVRKRLQPVGQ
jgi:N-acetylglucosamine kinase-like BadF-type ATPase